MRDDIYHPAELEEEDEYLIRKEIEGAAASEYALIRCVLLDNDLYATADVTFDMFESPAMRKIYRAIGDVLSSQKPADVVTVSEYMMEAEPHINWMEFVVDAMRGHGMVEQIEHYIAAIKNRHQKRRAREIAERMQIEITKDIGAIDVAIRDLMELGKADRRYEHDMGEILRGTLAKVEEAYDKHQRGETVGITTGLVDLDDAISGWHPTDLYILAARPAMGKTAVLLNLLLNSMKPFSIFSSEQEFTQIGQRMFAIEGLVNGNRMRRGKLDAAEWQKIQAAIHKLRERTFWINDKANMDINEITRQARKWRYSNKIEIMGVDYIQRLKATNDKMQMRDKVIEITLGLKSLAKELEIPIIGLAQVSRACESRPDKRPQMNDIQESAILEQESDGLCCLYRDEVYNEDTTDKGVMEWIWHKNRHGPTGTVRTQWQGEFFKVNNFASQYYQGGY